MNKVLQSRMAPNEHTRSLKRRKNVMALLSRLSAALLGVTLLVGPAAAESSAIKTMQDYMEFAPYEAGIIVPQQLSKEIFDSVVFIDTRDAAQFATGSIPGARNIE